VAAGKHELGQAQVAAGGDQRDDGRMHTDDPVLDLMDRFTSPARRSISTVSSGSLSRRAACPAR
jgi:hypothetical protein